MEPWEDLLEIDPRARIWKRVLALLIDLIVLNYIVFLPFGRFFTHDLGLLQYILLILISFLCAVYFIASEYMTSWTIGKRLLSIHVVSETGTLRLWQAVVRNLVIFSIFPFTLLLVIDPLFLLMNGKRFSDLAAKTDVYEG